MPENEEELHSLLMMEGDLEAGELDIPADWLEALARQGLACYVEPGIWIAAEHEDEYMRALQQQDEEAAMHIVRRMLYYRGGQTAVDVRERYFLSEEMTEALLDKLCRCKKQWRTRAYTITKSSMRGPGKAIYAACAVRQPRSPHLITPR